MLTGIAAITAFGYALMKFTTPSSEEMYKSLPPDLKKISDTERKKREEINRAFVENAKERAKSNEPGMF